MENVKSNFLTRVTKINQLSEAVKLYKQEAKSSEGYLNNPIFQRMRDGKNDELVTKFFAHPFAHVRIWLPQMFGLFIQRFYDHPYAYVVADNLSDEYGKYVGAKKLEPTHADLYNPLLKALKVPVKKETMSTPKTESSNAANNFYKWFREQVENKSVYYLLGHFLAYEITDVLDFPDYTTAIKRIYPDKVEIHEFFTQHAGSGHDESFGKDLQPVYEKHKKEMDEALANLLQHWYIFYEQSLTEIN